MKNMIRKALACLVVLAAFTLQSCLSDLFVTDADKAKLDITFEWFEPSTRSGEDALNIPDRAKMFLDFDGMHTYATYNKSTQRWTLDDVPSRESGSVTAFYAGTQYDEFYLQPAMKGTGTYDNTGDALSVSVRLQPQCGRLRFAGEPGKTVVVEGGLQYVCFGDDNFGFEYTWGSPVYLTVQPDGFTPYVYGFFLYDEMPYVAYTYDGQPEAKYFSTNFLTAGRSGFINLGPELPYDGPVLEGDFLIQNVETGLFLNGANSWGTQASAVPHGQFMTLSHQGGGRHTIDTHIANNSADYYLGNNGYVDAPSAAHTFHYDSNSQTWTIQAEETGLYLYNEDGNTVAFNSYDVSDRARWRIISKDEYMRSFYSATSSAPVDATPLIPDANFSRNNQDFYMWQGDMPAKGGDNSNMNAERWGGNTGTFDSYVTINDIPNGYYSLSVQGYYRYNNTDDNTNDIAAAAHADGTEVINSYFYANEVEEPLMSIADEAAVETYGKMPFSQGEASAAFNMGLYTKFLTVHVTDGTLRIGVKKVEHPGCDWTVWDNLELTYMGDLMSQKYAPIELGKLYQVNCDRGTWVYSNGVLTNDKISGMAPNTQSAAQQFAFVEYANQLYIWNQEGAHFLNNIGQCVNIRKASPVTFELQSNGTMFFHFTDAPDKYINMNDQGIVIDDWTTADAGNKMSLFEICDADMVLINSVIRKDMVSE